MPVTFKDHDSYTSRCSARRPGGGGAAAVAGLFLPGPSGAALRSRLPSVLRSPSPGPRGDRRPGPSLGPARPARRRGSAGAVGAAFGALAIGGTLGARLAHSGQPRWVARAGDAPAGLRRSGAATAALVGAGLRSNRRARFLPSGLAALVARRDSPGGGRACRRSAAIWSSGARRSRPSCGRFAARASSASCSAAPRAPIATRSRRSAARRRPRGGGRRSGAADDPLRQALARGRGRGARTLPGRSRRSGCSLSARGCSSRRRSAGARRARAGARGARRRSWLRRRDPPTGASARSARLEPSGGDARAAALAALRHRSADAARLGGELAPVVDELSEAGGDFDIAAEALDRGDASPALPSGRGRN